MLDNDKFYFLKDGYEINPSEESEYKLSIFKNENDREVVDHQV